jgi:hypothetical protein
MTRFLQKSIGISLMLLALAFLIRSIQPAHAERTEDFSQHNIVWVNVDSINANYHAFTDLYASEGKALEEQFQFYEKRVKEYQLRYETLTTRWTRTADEAIVEEAALAREEEALLIMEEMLTRMQNEALAKNDSINQLVTKYMDVYSKRKNIDYIIAVGAGSPILYAHTGLDVTAEITTEMNVMYDKQHKKPAGKK